uniref:Uncharacterized protein n=1 Tax=Anopheles maculatus TaxID=74869 RepID=A0A182T3Y4_9DIPT
MLQQVRPFRTPNDRRDFTSDDLMRRETPKTALKTACSPCVKRTGDSDTRMGKLDGGDDGSDIRILPLPSSSRRDLSACLPQERGNIHTTKLMYGGKLSFTLAGFAFVNTLVGAFEFDSMGLLDSV